MTACTHFLDFHRPGDPRAPQSAGRFLASALARGGISVAIASARNAKGILDQLAGGGLDPVAALQQGNLRLSESAEMLSRFTSRAGVNAERFDESIGAAMREAKARANGAPLRAFGDMVGVLWQREKRDDAVELERLWVRLQEQVGFELFCAYPIDIFGRDFTSGSLAGILEAHSHLSPSPASAELGLAFDRAMDEVLGERSLEVRSRSGESAQTSCAPMPKLEKTIMWLRTNLPDCADAVLSRTRRYYERAAPRTHLREEHSRC